MAKNGAAVKAIRRSERLDTTRPAGILRRTDLLTQETRLKPITRALSFGLLTLLVLTACRIERTPDEYIDLQTSDETERLDAQEELRARILAFGQGLARGNELAALRVLAPAGDVQVIAPAEPGVEVGARAALDGVAAAVAARRPLRAQNVDVNVNERANLAWFSATLPLRDEAAPLRISGVFLRQEGTWRLVQMHVSDAAEQPADEE